ncbi:membrane hypothetical protein [Candidatus Sulfopaludibacter sp. SbA4]|nr:membrane hypothetical protein [Candidatus Sulfopaludibacter sp. SbA4]
MDTATENRRADTFSAILAGLQAGMLGVCWMLAWLGISAKWELRSFWTAENLMASAFYGDGAIRSGFAAKTLSGVALYLLIYSTLGALFAGVVADRLPRFRVVLMSVLFAMGWYYLSFRLLWKSLMPLVALLHSAQPTALGHMIYGAVLGRYPVYLARQEGTATEPTAVEALEKSGQLGGEESGDGVVP